MHLRKRWQHGCEDSSVVDGIGKGNSSTPAALSLDPESPGISGCNDVVTSLMSVGELLDGPA